MGPILFRVGFWVGTVACASLAQIANAQWTQLGGSPSRLASARSIVPALGAPTWTCNTDESGNTITFVPQGGIVATIDAVFAIGAVSPPGGPANQRRVFAVSRITGHVSWSAFVDVANSPSVADGSVSAPAIDLLNGTVMVASNSLVRAFHLSDGSPAWQAPLNNFVVNASPLVTTDRPGKNRAFITDYGGSAGLYCINVDPFDAQINPYEPGQVLWRTPIGRASGATPAYLATPDGGHVFVATYRLEVNPGESLPGKVQCFPASSTTAPSPIWATDNPTPQGFFGGVCVQSHSSCGASVFVASYAFDDGVAANLLKLDAATGSPIWSIPCNRTDAIPVPLGNGDIALSGGIDGFGTVLNLALFHDLGATALAAWDTAGALTIGGRVVQPTAITSPDGIRLLCGAGAAGGDDLGPSTDLYVIDSSQSPGSHTFIADHFEGAGGGAIIANGNIYTLGEAGLLAFGPTPAKPDVNQDGLASIDDVYAWNSGLGARDVDQSGVVNQADLTRLLSELRAFERLDMTEGRP